MQVGVRLNFWGIYEDFDFSLIQGLNPQNANVYYYKDAFYFRGESDSLPLKKVLEALKKYNIRLSSWSIGFPQKDPSDWKPENLEKMGIIGAYLRGDKSIDLRNPRDDYADSSRLKEGVIPDIKKTYKVLVSCLWGNYIFSKEICDFLKGEGAEFETTPVKCKGEIIDTWFQIFAKHKIEILSPDCHILDKNGKPTKFDDCHFYYLAGEKVKPFLFAEDSRRVENQDNSCVFAINKELMLKFLSTFKKSDKYLQPIFSSDSPIGKLFYQVKKEVDPFICLDPIPEKKPKPPRPFKVKDDYETLFTFKGEKFQFDLVESDPVSGGERFCCEEFESVLIDTGKIPDKALEAPIASWILARIVAETGGKLKPRKSQNNDGGGFVFEFLVKDFENNPVASFQFQGNTERTVLLGDREKTQDGDLINLDFAKMLVSDSEKLAKCEIKVKDLEWKEDPDDYEPTPDGKTRNFFGWDGEKFLGSDNVWSQFSSGDPRPDSFKTYQLKNYQDWKKRKKK